MSDEIKIITLGDIFKNIETEEKAFKFKDYITNLQQENDRLNNIINELEKWIDEYYKSNRKWYNNELSNHDRRYYEREYINTEAMLVKFDKKLKELKENKYETNNMQQSQMQTLETIRNM